jgi:hypothetical protein
VRQSSELKPGDLLFFAPPTLMYSFHKDLLVYQALVSCFLCFCNTQDYRKSHVAICTAIAADGLITVGHIGTEGIYENAVLSDKLLNRTLAVLRPKDKNFASALANTASRPTSTEEITFSKRSFWTVLPCVPSQPSCWTKLPCVPSARDNSLTADRFSIETHCSRFVYEALNLAAQSPKMKSHQITASGDMSVSRLWQRLHGSGLYTDLGWQKGEYKTEVKSEIKKTEATPLLKAQEIIFLEDGMDPPINSSTIQNIFKN